MNVGPLLSFVGWSFLPSLLSAGLLNIVYNIFPRYRPKTRLKADIHARLARTIVVAAYLIYTLFSTYLSLAATPNYYQIIGLDFSDCLLSTPDEWDRTLKSQWRKIARVFHPDKMGHAVDPELEQRFVAMRAAYETLADPIQKVAYDRFGTDVLTACIAHRCVTMRDYLIKGFQQSAPFYIAGLSGLVLLSVTPRMEYGKYVRFSIPILVRRRLIVGEKKKWRFASLAVVCGLETTMLSASTSKSTSALSGVPFLAKLVIHEQILFLHHLLLNFNGALAQIGPILFPLEDERVLLQKQEMSVLAPLINQLRQLGSLTETSIGQLSRNEMQPLFQAVGLRSMSSEDAGKNLEVILQKVEDATVDALCDLQLKNQQKSQKAAHPSLRETADENVPIKKEESQN